MLDLPHWKSENCAPPPNSGSSDANWRAFGQGKPDSDPYLELVWDAILNIQALLLFFFFFGGGWTV